MTGVCKLRELFYNICLLSSEFYKVLSFLLFAKDSETVKLDFEHGFMFWVGKCSDFLWNSTNNPSNCVGTCSGSLCCLLCWICASNFISEFLVCEQIPCRNLKECSSLFNTDWRNQRKSSLYHSSLHTHWNIY